MRFATAIPLLMFLILAGCAPPVETPEPEVDLEAARNALLDADRAWLAAYSASNSPADPFVAALVDDAYLLPPGAPMERGKEAIHGAIASLEAMPGFGITWAPTTAKVGSAGDLGYTIGTYEMTMETQDGPIRIDGKYMTVWEKQSDGSWKVTADMFNANGPPTPQM